MTRLLVSVRDASEAAEALAAGAHLIDVKEPRRGALGMADAATIGDVVQTIGGRVPVSAALGELIDLGESASLLPNPWPTGLAFAKLGLAHVGRLNNWRERWRWQLDQLPPGVSRVAVAYADWERAGAPHPMDVLAAGIELGCAAILLDTFDKTHGDLFAFASDDDLAQLLTTARQARMLSVLAGSIRLETLERAASIGPDFVAVRGAACAGGRDESICTAQVRRLVVVLKNTENEAVFARSAGATEIQDSVA